MIAKWIRLRARDRDAFAAAQGAWSALDGVDGFVRQLGGWLEDESYEAAILSLWQSRDAYEAFMKAKHDDIAAEQAETIERSVVAIGDVSLTMGDGDATGDVLRIAECVTKSNRVEQFVAAQSDVWMPGMLEAGMTGGFFVKLAPYRFLVASLWPTAAKHADYVSGPFPELRSKAKAEDDLLSVKGALVLVEDGWTVPANAPDDADPVV